MTKIKKKKTRRSATKYPALEPKFNLKSRYELIDYDYLDQLTEKDKDWLNTFTEEYTGANFNHGKKKLHKTKKLKKSCYDMNNSRNRCQLTKAKASGKYDSLSDIDEADILIDMEDRLIYNVDKKKKD